ncbi:MAG: hypothetical protein L6Q99_02500 [Planctomycetes bacterium]|nr:hypothetical protein [Planctomycetota bacterium]
MGPKHWGTRLALAVAAVSPAVATLTVCACSRVPDPPEIVVVRPTASDRSTRVAEIRQQYDDAHERWLATHRALGERDATRFSVLHPPPRLTPWLGLLWEIVDARPDDDAALEAACVVATRQRRGADCERALSIAVEHHVENPRIGELLRSLDISASASAERLLEAVLARNPERDVRGLACLTLGIGRLEFAALIERSPKPDDLESYVADLGWITDADERFEAVARARRTFAADAETLRASAVAVLRRAVDEFDDVPYFDETIGEKARAALITALELGVGQPAPEIVGEDLDGRPMKLSEFHGKVVVLDFWGDW